jgi:flagellar biosynthetic protein FliO
MNNLLTFLKKWIETSSRKQKWTAVLTIFGLVCTIILLSLDGGSQTTRDPLGSTPLYFAGALIKLLMVLLLMVIGAILARRWVQPGLRGKGAHQMRLVETVRLSPKQALHLIAVGDQQLLIGATDQSIALITQVEANLDPAPAEMTTPGPALEFGSLLQTFGLRLTDGSSK